MVVGCSSVLERFGQVTAVDDRDVRASSFLFQGISVVVQRFKSVLLHDGFVDDRPEDTFFNL